MLSFDLPSPSTADPLPLSCLQIDLIEAQYVDHFRRGRLKFC